MSDEASSNYAVPSVKEKHSSIIIENEDYFLKQNTKYTSDKSIKSQQTTETYN